MADVVIMPRQGQSVESCIIAKWHKKKGDKVKAGDLLFTYETDKSSFDEEAKTDGILLDVFFNEGDDVECLLNVCAIGEEGEDVSSFNPNNQTQKAEEAPQETKTVQPEAETVETRVADVPAAEDAVKISPRARMRAGEKGVDYHYAIPTGPHGRIIERDILAMDSPAYTKAASTAMGTDFGSATGIGGRFSLSDRETKADAAMPTQASEASMAAYTDEKMPNIRKVIAKSMHASLSEMAQLTLNASFDATEILAYRAKLKAQTEKMGLHKITLNDIVLFAVSRTLLQHPDINANLIDGNVMRRFHTVNLGVAVDTPRGLMVPTVFSAEKLSLNDMAAKSKELATAAKEGNISPDSLKGGSFTVTNLGSFGVESFTPVINPPQTAILGVDNMTKRVREINGEIKVYSAMGLSLTFDHRAVDGAPAARFLKDLCDNLENFSITLAK